MVVWKKIKQNEKVLETHEAFRKKVLKIII